MSKAKKHEASRLTGNNGGAFFKTVGKELLGYLSDRIYMLFLAVTAIGSYGFLVTHYSISVDDLEPQYYYSAGLLSQGRLTAMLLHRLTGFVRNAEWIQDFIGIFLLCIATILFCVIFDRCIKTKSRLPQIFFSCIFISYPLHTELFSYGGTTIAVGGGCIIVALCLLIMGERERGNRRLFYATLLLIPAVSWYESVLSIYVAAVFAVLLLCQMNSGKYKFKDFLGRGLQYVIPLVSAVVLEALLIKSILFLLGVSKEQTSGSRVYWDFSSAAAFAKRLSYLLTSIFNRLFLQGLWYFPITVFAVLFIIIFVVFIIHTKKTKSLSVGCCYLGLMLTPFILPFILCASILYRTCQVLSFFVGFSAFLLTVLITLRKDKIGQKRLYRFACAAFALLIIWQTGNTSYWLTLDYRRYEFEKAAVVSIGSELERNFDLTKPVLFVGNFDESDYIKERKYVKADDFRVRLLQKSRLFDSFFEGYETDGTYLFAYQQTNNRCYINWGITAFKEVNTSLIKFFKYCGVSGIKSGTLEQYHQAQELAKSMKAWPQAGSIKDCGEIIVVNFGNHTQIGNSKSLNAII